MRRFIQPIEANTKAGGKRRRKNDETEKCSGEIPGSTMVRSFSSLIGKSDDGGSDEGEWRHGLFKGLLTGVGCITINS